MMERKHFTLDELTQKRLLLMARQEKLAESEIVRLALNSLYNREFAPWVFTRSQIGRPRKRME